MRLMRALWAVHTKTHRMAIGWPSDGHRTEWVLYPIFPTDGSYFSILSASDVCECYKVLYRNPFCPMVIRCPSDVNIFGENGPLKKFENS